MFDVAAVRDTVLPRLESLMANTRLEPIRARNLITLKGTVREVLAVREQRVEGMLTRETRRRGRNCG